MAALKSHFDEQIRRALDEKSKLSSALAAASASLEQERASRESLDKKFSSLERQLAMWKADSVRRAAQERQRTAILGRNALLIFLALTALVFGLLLWNYFIVQSQFGGTLLGFRAPSSNHNHDTPFLCSLRLLSGVLLLFVVSMPLKL